MKYRAYGTNDQGQKLPRKQRKSARRATYFHNRGLRKVK